MGTKILAFIFIIAFFTGCNIQKSPKTSTSYSSMIENSPVFSQHFMGFSLYDPQTDKIIHDINSDKYFTPASNTKLFTFYTCLQILSDSVPSLQYSTSGDSLFFTGTGDPSFLHPEFSTQKTFEFLNNRNERLFYVNRNFQDEAYGPGWSWDDYHYSFSAEKAPFPVYGNFVNFVYQPLQMYPEVHPEFFSRFVNINELERTQVRNIHRAFFDNIFSIQIRRDTVGDTLKIPFKVSPELLVQLLSDTLKRDVYLLNDNTIVLDKVFAGFATDSLYREMLVESDNFIAEQLMLLCAFQVSDTLKVKNTIDYAKENLFKDMEDSIRWVDGSGLSRYNLFTPRSMIYILKKIHDIVPEARLFSLFPEGGTSGTLKKWYKADMPYVYAKTGTLSNVHCLSGYIKTKSGKTMIFSFMHNNYVSSTNTIRFEMEKVIRQIHLEF